MLSNGGEGVKASLELKANTEPVSLYIIMENLARKYFHTQTA